MTKETINTSTRATKFGQRPRENPIRGTPFEILLLLYCHKMFNKEYNEPNKKSSNKINPKTF